MMHIKLKHEEYYIENRFDEMGIAEIGEKIREKIDG
jgi:hypothetical protein